MRTDGWYPFPSEGSTPSSARVSDEIFLLLWYLSDCRLSREGGGLEHQLLPDWLDMALWRNGNG